MIHLIGKERPGDLSERAAKTFPNYHVYPFFTHEMAYAYALADVVVARAGFGTLTELAALKKCAVIIPMTGTHQEENAQFFGTQQAIVALHGEHESGYRMAHGVIDLMADTTRRIKMGETLHQLLPQAEPATLVEIIDTLVHR